MSQRRFYNYLGPINLKELALKLEGIIIQPINQPIDNANLINILDIKNIEDANSGNLTFISNSKYITHIYETKATVCLIAENLVYDPQLIPANLWLIKCKNPYYSYSKALKIFYNEKSTMQNIAVSATISVNAIIQENVIIGPNVVIEEGVTIGKGTIIEGNSIIKQGVTIGEDCYIGASSTIAYATLEDRVRIYSGVRIGNDGFGFATHQGIHHKILHIGQVIIRSDVEIGANTTIDRGSNKDTIVGEGTIIDNLVQIGHNVVIGKGCVIVAQVGIAGSTTLEDYCVLGGQAGIAGHLKLGKGVQVSGQAGVMTNLEPGQIVGGSPAIAIRDWHKQTILLKKMLNERKNATTKN